MSWKRLFHRIGFLVLSIMVLLLYSFTAYHSWIVKRIGALVVVFIISGLIKGIVIEGKHLWGSDHRDHLFTSASVKAFAAVMAGAIIAFALKVNLGLGPVVGAGLTALIASLVVPSLGVPIYCGAFVGMTSARLFIEYTDLCLAAAIAGAIYLLTQRSYLGLGGKLGTVAFTGTFVTGFGLKREFLLTPFPQVELLFPIVLCAILATAFTYYLNVTLGHGAVVASAGTGLIGGLILPNYYPGEVGTTLAVMTICASFAGMSSAERIPNWWAVILMGFLTGVIFIFSMPLAGGAGGKLGTISFGAAISVHAWSNIFLKTSE
jgi:hypothetical protein